MISFRLRRKWQNCRGYVPRYERTSKNGCFDIHSVFATHVETVVLMSTQRNKDRFPGRDGEIRQLNSLRVYGQSEVRADGLCRS